MPKHNFGGAVGLAKMYCDENPIRRKKSIDKYVKGLIEYATNDETLKRIGIINERKTSNRAKSKGKPTKIYHNRKTN